jgi:formate-dependent nitrite reductase membrane component NrfD
MKAISGSILILAAAVLLQPAVENDNRLDEAIVFAAPFLLVGLFLLFGGQKKDR